MKAFLKGISFLLPVLWTKRPNSLPKWISSIPIAHRGLFDHGTPIPENSLLAFKNAIAQGYAIELDVHLSKDKEVVVHHDANLLRLSQDKRLLQDLSVLELKEIKLLKTQEYIPTLKEVLELVNGQVPVYVEIKQDKEEEQKNRTRSYLLEQRVLDVLANYLGPVALLSFDPQTLRYISQNAPKLLRGQNFCPQADDLERPHFIIKDILGTLATSRPHFIVYDHMQVPGFIAKGLSYFSTMISYNVNSLEDYNLVKSIAQNIIFENIDINILLKK